MTAPSVVITGKEMPVTRARLVGIKTLEACATLLTVAPMVVNTEHVLRQESVRAILTGPVPNATPPHAHLLVVPTDRVLLPTYVCVPQDGKAKLAV